MADKMRLTLTGRQRDGAGVEDVTETKTAAQYYEKNGGRYLLYEEAPEGTDAVSKNLIKFKGGVLELTKKGAVNARMVFEEGAEHLTDYATPYGCLKLGVLTHSVSCDTEEGRIRIGAEYTLLSEGQVVSECRIDILAERV